MLCAIAQDANNQMFRLAWAVVGVENEVNWTWFLQILMEELGIRDGNGVTIISDQQKVSKMILLFIFTLSKYFIHLLYKFNG